MDIFALFAVIWVVGRIIAAVNKKNSGGPSKQQQAVEEQKKRREAFDAAKRQQQAQQRSDGDIPPYRRAAAEDDIPPYRRGSAAEPPIPGARPLESHHIDETEEERCSTAEQVRQERRLQELRERFGTPTRPPARPLTARTNRPQTLVQAQRQLYTNSPPVSQAPPAPPAPKPPTAAKRPVAAAPQVRRSGLPIQGNALVQGIIMAEILGPPQAKKTKHGAF